MTGPILPVEGRLFEDTIDGYFPLTESLRQMLVRQGFAAAWIVMSHAPMMHLPGLAADAPVPLRLDQARAGMVRRLCGFVRLVPEGSDLGAVGRWRWLDGSETDALPRDIRLAEPAFLRGIGIAPGMAESGWLGRVAAKPGSNVALCTGQALSKAAALPDWSDATVWGPCLAEGGIQAVQSDRSTCGRALSEDVDWTTEGGAILLRGTVFADHPIVRAMRLDA